MSKSLSLEYSKKNITVNCIAPGWIMTERQLKEYVSPAVKRQIREAQCIPDLIQTDEVADVALFLASDVSRAMTGQQFVVDRGWVHK